MKETIPEEKISEVREKANILEVVADFVALKKTGRNHLGLCPFHSEKTPSFTVNEEKGIFHCFGCGVGGNVFTFLMRANNLSFPEAVRVLAKKYGVSLPQRELTEAERRQKTLRARLFDLNEMAAQYYHQILISQKEGEMGRRYLAHRGIRDEIIQEYRLGFAPSSWEALGMFLQNKGVPLNLAETLGLILPRKDRGGHYDRFRQRVMFPILSEGGRVIGFGGRIVEDSPINGQEIPAPKYMNSPESPIYSKGLTLYGIHAAKGPIREQGVAVIVEGYMDLLSLVQEGIRPVVASLGTALTRAQVALLGRYAREAVLVFDADEGGKKATQRSLELFLQEGISARVASLPSGFDPDTFIRKEKRAGFENVLAHSLPVVDFLLEQALRNHPIETVEGKVRAVRELIPALISLRDPLTQNLYIERVASRLRLKESLIRDQLRTRPEPREPSGGMPVRTPHGPMHERLLLQLMLTHPQSIPRVGKALGQEGFSDPRYQKLVQILLQRWEADGTLDQQKFFEQIAQEDLKALASELLLAEASVVDADRMLRDCLRELKLSRLRQEIQRVDDEIRQRSRLKKEDPWEAQGLKELLKRKQRLITEQKHWINEAARGLRPA